MLRGFSNLASSLNRPVSVLSVSQHLKFHPTSIPSSLINSFIVQQINFRALHQEAPDYYGILGVKKSADISEIKLAYFNMAKKFHPDTNKTLDARQVFSLIAEAYEVLSDESRRAKYDETGLGEERFGGRADGPGRQSTDNTYTSEQMYQKIFGDRGATAGMDADNDGEVHQDYSETFSGTDVTKEYIAKLSFEEAFLGTTIQIQFRYVGVCVKCDGSRSELGYTGNICPYCEGTGEETIRTGHVTARTTCSYCEGTKIFIKYKCLECEGIGRKTYDAPLDLVIPPGTVNGEVFRLEVDTKSLAMIEKDRKVIWVTVSVEESDIYKMDERDLVTHMEISPALAVLGGETGVQTPARMVKVHLESCTDSGKVIVIPEEGLRANDTLPGDLVINTSIRVPTQLTWRQKRILRKFAKIECLGSDKLVSEIQKENDHKLLVNVIEADKIVNNIVKPEKVDRFQRTITQTLRDKLGIKEPEKVKKPAYPHHYHRIFSF